jgi:hypothetical protein
MKQALTAKDNAPVTQKPRRPFGRRGFLEVMIMTGADASVIPMR